MYARLRVEDPVHRSPLGIWILTRYDDVASVLRDPRFSREGFETVFAAVNGEPAERRPSSSSLLYRDPPDHTRLRGAVGQALTPRAVKARRPRVWFRWGRLGRPRSGRPPPLPGRWR